MLYDLFCSLPLKDELKEQLHKVVLATSLNNMREFVQAKDVLLNIIRDINDGILTVSSTLRAVFAGAYDKAKRYVYKSVDAKEEIPTVKAVPFYNWLVERDDQPRMSQNKPMLDNWLLW